MAVHVSCPTGCPHMGLSLPLLQMSVCERVFHLGRHRRLFAAVRAGLRFATGELPLLKSSCNGTTPPRSTHVPVARGR